MAAADWTPEAVIRACYRAILGREAESEAVVRDHAARHATPDRALRAFLGSDEHREGQRRAAALARLAAAGPVAPPVPGALRVLLFGAYGNGNLGDAAQPPAVAALLREAAPAGLALDLRACSWIASAPYPVDRTEGALPAEAVLDPATLAGFDLLVIGGGGLFGTPHFPLLDPAWIAHLRRDGPPYALLGVGVSREVLADPGHGAAWASLVAGAAFVSVRERESLAEGAVPPGAHWLADPVLLAGLRGLGEAGARHDPGAAAAPPLCIVKHPAHAVEAQFLDWVAAAPVPVTVAAVEPGREAGLARRFPGLRVPRSMAELQALCAEAPLVVSTRYHGCIAALLAGVPCVGLGPGKNGALFAALGAPGRFLPHCGPLAALLRGPPPGPLPEAAWQPLRAAGEAGLAALGALLGQVAAARGVGLRV